MSSDRASRFSSFLGGGCWPEMSPMYLKHCCGDVTSLRSDHFKIFEDCKSQMGGDVTKGMLRSYTRNDIYGEVNKHLLTCSAELQHTGGYVHHLKSAIKARLQSYSATGMVYRGMQIPKSQVHLYRYDGRRFVWPCFVSASHDHSIAKDFADSGGNNPDKQKMVFHINTKGFGTTYVVDIADISDYPHEKEALFYPYSGFQIEESSMDGEYLVVKCKAFDSKTYFNHFLQKIEVARHGWPNGERRVPLCNCWYTEKGTKYCAMSTALVPKFASGGFRWGSRGKAQDLGKMISDAWKDKFNIFFVGSGANTWSAMCLAGFGDSQKYMHDADVEKLKKWIKDAWDEKKCITSFAVNDDHYFCVMTHGAPGFESGLQRWAFRTDWDDLVGWMNEGYKDGYIVTYGSWSTKKNQYVMVMTKSPKAQASKSAKEFPKEWVQEQWSKGRSVTTILYTEDKKYAGWPWWVVCTSDSGTNNSYSTYLSSD